MSDKKRIRPIINTQWLKEQLAALRQWVGVKANTTLPADNPKPALEGVINEVANEFSGVWTRFEGEPCAPLTEAIDRTRDDIAKFDGETLATNAETRIQTAETTLQNGLRKEAAERVEHETGRATDLRLAQADLEEKTESTRLQKIRTCGDEDAPIDPATGMEATIKTVSEIIMIGVAIGIEVMIGIKAQQHGSNLMMAIGITAAALMLLFTTAHYGMTALKRIVSYPDFVTVFNEKYPMDDDGRHYDRFGRVVELALLDSADRFIAVLCLVVCFLASVVVVGYRFIAVEGSSLAETTNLGAILMVLLTALFAIEKFHFALKYNADEYNRWVSLSNNVRFLRDKVNMLLMPDEAANEMFRQACDVLESAYTTTVEAILREINDTVTALRDARNFCLVLWDEYLGHAREFVEVHFRDAVETLVPVICKKNSINPDDMKLSFAEVRPMIEDKMIKRHENTALYNQFKDFRFAVPMADNLQITNFSQLEAQMIREAEAAAANAAVGHYRLAN